MNDIEAKLALEVVEAARKYRDICQCTVGSGIGNTKLWDAYRILNTAIKAWEDLQKKGAP